MHIQSNLLYFYTDMANEPIQFPERTDHIMIEYNESVSGNKWKVRCYDKEGNRLDSLKFTTKD